MENQFISEEDYQKALATAKAFENQLVLVKVKTRKKGWWTEDLAKGHLLIAKQATEKDLMNCNSENCDPKKYFAVEESINFSYYEQYLKDFTLIDGSGIILKSHCEVIKRVR